MSIFNKKKLYDAQYQTAVSNPAAVIDHSFYRPLLGFAKNRHQIICEMLGSEKFENVLELGCGRGDIVRQKHDLFGRYTGLDLSSYQFLQIPEFLKTKNNFAFRDYDLDMPLDYASDSFDLILSASTIEYLFDPIAFIQEIYRVLKPGGTSILHTVNLAFFPRRLQLLVGKLPTFNALPGWQGGNLHDFTYPTLAGLLKQTGFQIVRTRCSGLFPGLRFWWPNLLAGDMIFRCVKPLRAS
ncbi:MAG: class I SAM-dependent methyltransferase [Candidatus Omnitrophica bacterium]|nr:class I SAM-dependent methyltransferase [Candidatus Omnitrophota bacterium]